MNANGRMNCSGDIFLNVFVFLFFCFLNSIPAKDIRMVPSTTPEEVLEESLDVAQTDGEWELINIEIVPITLQIAVGNYSQIRIHVSTP